MINVNSVSFWLISAEVLHCILSSVPFCPVDLSAFASESRTFESEKTRFDGDSPVCRDLVISSYQKYITQLLVLKIGLHLSKGLFRMVCGLEKLI